MATASAQGGSTESKGLKNPGWIYTQKKTFASWVNEKLKDTPHKVEVLENAFDDGLTLITLLEILSKKKMHKRYVL